MSAYLLSVISFLLSHGKGPGAVVMIRVLSLRNIRAWISQCPTAVWILQFVSHASWRRGNLRPLHNKEIPRKSWKLDYGFTTQGFLQKSQVWRAVFTFPSALSSQTLTLAPVLQRISLRSILPARYLQSTAANWTDSAAQTVQLRGCPLWWQGTIRSKESRNCKLALPTRLCIHKWQLEKLEWM